MPDYRITPVNSAGQFVGVLGRALNNGPIPLSNIPEKYRVKVATMQNRQPISAVEDLLSNKDSGTFRAPWPPDLVKYHAQDVYEGMTCLGAWQIIPRGSVVALIDAVRNRILSFAIEIESVAPGAGEAAPGSTPIAADTVHQVFQTNIYGGTVGNVATGAGTITQTSGVVVSQGDWASLSAQLSDMGFEKEDVSALKDALAADGSSTKPEFGKKVAGWLGNALGKAASGTLKVGVAVASKVLPELISSYLGLPKPAL